MKPDTLEHKQYLIDSIDEMTEFINKCIDKLHTDKELISDTAAKAIQAVIDRKKQNIQQFKNLLKSQYNHII